LTQAKEAAAAVGLADTDLVVLDGEGQETTGHPNAAELMAGGAPAPEVSFAPSSHLAALPYSSGTTGNPKGVMLTHRNLVANVAQIRPLHGMVADDVVLAVLPFFHIYGMTVLLNAALHTRARLVVMPSFDLGEFLGNIANHKCTIAFIAPPVAVALAKHPLVDEYDLSSLKVVMSGAAPLDADLGHAVAERLGCRVVQGYGMSELSPVSHITPFDGGAANMGTVAPLSSVGWTVSNAASKLIDPETGDEIDPPAEGLSRTGELWFKGPNVMAGYLGNEEATRETIDDEGWLHTGDLAQVDACGCVYIVDRLKELIKYKGYQVPPAELEALLLSHPAIADAAVVGVNDDEGEEVPKAFVVKQSGAELTADEVMEFVAGQVAPYKKVRQVEFIDAIPKSASGKILRKDLRVAT
jgi:acyl-CoA synthetase (AMP-forming)/AMP-acid ligase II